jgi:hypothetical protein
VDVAATLLNSGRKRLKARFLKADGAADSEAGISRAVSDSPLVRLANTIRRQVLRYRSGHPDWRRDFDLQLERFRASYFRDQDWYRETEEHHAQWFSDFEKRQEFEWVEAMRIVSMARLYQEQRKFRQAAAIYRKAILIARRARMNEALRGVVVARLLASVKASLRTTRSLRDPVYFGPRTGVQPRVGEVTGQLSIAIVIRFFRTGSFLRRIESLKIAFRDNSVAGDLQH